MAQGAFDEEYRYKDDEEGISISVTLTYSGKTIRTDAKVDSGSAVCLFSHEDGFDLGISIEQGDPTIHNTTLETLSSADGFAYVVRIYHKMIIGQQRLQLALDP